MSGATAAGAGIGSAIAPGVGTAVGAGIGALVDGLFSLFGGHQQSNATKDAAKLQAAATDKALAEQKRIFDMQRQDRAPFLAASQSALGSLGQLANSSRNMSLPAAYGQPPSAQMPMGQPPALGAMGGMMPRPTQPGPPEVANEPMGTFRAPDGETRQFPLSLESQLVAKGAKRIG